MKTKKINKDEKLCFALDYIPVEKQYKKTKKIRNLVNLFTIIVAGVSLGFGMLGSIPTAITVAVLSSLVLLPSMYVFNSKMREVIDTINHSNITFRQFRKMERSGELDKLIKEAKTLQTSPAYIGIEKFATNNSLISTQNINSKQRSSSFSKNNDGRNI